VAPRRTRVANLQRIPICPSLFPALARDVTEVCRADVFEAPGCGSSGGVHVRLAIVVLGVVLAVVGAGLLLAPVSPRPDQTVREGLSIAFSVQGFSLTGSIPVAVSWASTLNATITVYGLACSTTCTSNNVQGQFASQTGKSGSFLLDQPIGGTVLIYEVTKVGQLGNVTVKTATALPTEGSILVIVGIVVLTVGMVLRPKKQAMA